MGRPEFPYVVEKGSVKVVIYHSVTRGKYHNYTLAYYQDGVRKRPVFSDFKKAKTEALFVAKRLGSKDADVLELRSSDRAAYQRARELLDSLGVGVEMAAAQFADAKNRLGDVPLFRAVDFYLQEHAKVKEVRTVPQVVNELCDAKEIDRLSHVYLKHLRYNLGKFAGRFKGNIEDVSGPDIDSWLRESGLSPRSRNNIRTAIGTLFNFAKARRYLRRDRHELEAVAVVKQPVVAFEAGADRVRRGPAAGEAAAEQPGGGREVDLGIWETCDGGRTGGTEAAVVCDDGGAVAAVWRQMMLADVAEG